MAPITTMVKTSAQQEKSHRAMGFDLCVGIDNPYFLCDFMGVEKDYKFFCLSSYLRFPRRRESLLLSCDKDPCFRREGKNCNRSFFVTR